MRYIIVEIKFINYFKKKLLKMSNENGINISNQQQKVDSIEDSEIFEDDYEETFKDQDDFILSEFADPISITSAPELESSSNVPILDRIQIMHKQIDDINLKQTLGLNKVDVYDAGKLEKELIDQASKIIQATENNQKKRNGIKKIARVFQEADDSVKKGDLTPFELMINKQEELATIRSKNNKKTTIKSEYGKQNQKFIHFPTNLKTNRKRKCQSLEEVASEDDGKGGYYQPSYNASSSSSSEYYTDSEVDDEPSTSKSSKKKAVIRRKTIRMAKDDGDEEHFAERIRNYEIQQQNDALLDEQNGFHELRDEHHISNYIWNNLYKYQKTGIRWLYELHSQCVGGILADEMGLGKTIQISAFLRSISESQKQSRIFKFKGLGPSLIICPATVLHQWVRELNVWFPLCKVAVLHSSGAHSGSKSALIKKMGEYRKNGSILVTSYSTYMLEYKKILNVNWHYVVLDEGHKIRNPDAKVTITMKELRTPHRLILSGSPLQNNLKELWSLIDFIYPGLLGSLKEFVEKFSIPITQGGYANATTIQVRTAYKCACVLRDAINPYLLRRMKKDVQMMIQLPEKTEQILFCDITNEQRKFYVEFIESKACQEAVTGSQMPFAALMYLRKLCNHPDLATGGPNKYGDLDLNDKPELEYGAYQRSGKMIVLRTLLYLWFEQGQKVLLFSQSRQMLTIIEKFIILEGYEYLRMDGTTPIGRRQDLVARLNEDKNIFIFLLTTRVGGLGVNLTGANRVIIFDPDWNPSTDAQARERAWRIGQNRAVTIYRLLTSGTIEEKIYQRQIFKHFLANRILVNPKQQRFFKTNDLHELFTLGASKSDKKYGTETAIIFAECSKSKSTRGKTTRKEKNKSPENIQREEIGLDKSFEKMEEAEEKEQINCELSEEAKERLRKLAKKYASTPIESAEINQEKGKNENKKKKEKRGLFEGKYAVPMLKKQETSKNKEEEEGRIESNKEQDDYVLGKLLKNKSVGVNSALQHDQIMKNGSISDIQLVEDEANAVAKRAVEVLKRSRRIHKTFLENVSEFSSLAPKITQKTIFGQKIAVEFVERSQNDEIKQRNGCDENGEKNKGKQYDGSALLKMRNKAAASGADLLLSIKQRKEQQLDINTENDVNGRDEEEIDEIQNYPSLSAQVHSSIAAFNDRYEKMAEDIRSFLAISNGQASTNSILEHFKDKVKNQDSFIFRSTLKRLCKLLPNSQWILREEFSA